MNKLRATLAGAALLCAAALPQAAQARVFVGVGFGLGPVFYPAPYYYAPPPVYYAPPPVYYAPPPAYYPPPAPPVSYGANLSTTCRTARASCPMDRPGVIGGGCTCPGPNGASLSGTIR